MARTLPRQANNALLPIAIAVMDACWIFASAWLFEYGLLYSLSPFQVPNPALLALLELAAVWFVGQTLAGRFGGNLLRAATALIGLPVSLGLIAVLNVPAGGATMGQWLLRAALPLAVCVGVWLLGGYRSTRQATFATVYRAFVVGLAVMGAGVLLASLVTGSRGPAILSTLAGVPVAFFAASLVALAMGNREMIRQETGSGSGPFWGVITAASIGGVLLLSILGGTANLPGILDIASRVVSSVLLAVGLLLYQILYWVLWLWSQIFPIDPRLPDTRNVVEPTKGPNLDPLANLRKMMEGGKPGQMPPDLQNLFMWIAGVTVGILVVVALVVAGRFLSRNRPPAVRSMPEERESFGSWALVKARFLQWWLLLLARFRPRRATSAVRQEDELAALRGNPDWTGTLSVRQIYARMQLLAARRGYPRAPQQTPIEYLNVLSQAMPPLRADFAAITSAYIEARYGPMPASAPAVLAATNAWKRAEKALGET